MRLRKKRKAAQNNILDYTLSEIYITFSILLDAQQMSLLESLEMEAGGKSRGKLSDSVAVI
jgi:hypothetical protein